MSNEMQRGNLTGTAIMRMPISGTVSIGGKQMKELRFMPYSEFPEEGREDVLYIDTDGNAMYYWDGTEYIALSGGGSGGTGDYNELSNKPQINGNTLTGNKTAANLGLQETISDIDTIRSGAESGSTAVQPETLATALETKQDVISDLASIRSGASKGDTAVQPSDMETALADKQNVINDLDAIRSGATAGNTALQPEDIDTLPTDGSSNPVSSGGTYNFVNSSIATNTAYFIGTFASVAELEAYTGTVTNNDYAFVTSTDSAGNTLYNRYKYNAATQEWSFEYAVNNTAFTAAQWAAIQSGLTSSDKTKLDGIEQGANKTVIDATPTSGSSNAVSSGGVRTALSGKQDIIADLSDIRSGASAGATAVQPSTLTDYQTKLSGTNKLDPAYIEYDASHRAVSDTEKTTWNGKQDTISDLSTIRSGAAAGATALQQSDVASTYSSSGTSPVNGTAINAAIGTLDVSSVGGAGKYISAISETDGKISATPTTFDTALSSSSTNNNAPTAKAVYDDQQRQDAEIAWNVNNGVKNLLSVNGGSGTNVQIFSQSGIIKSGNYVMTFKASDFSGNYALNFYDANGALISSGSLNGAITADKSVSFTLGQDAYTVKFFILGRAIISELMLRPASITDSTFVPYAKTNRELTVAEDEDRAALVQQVDEGAKNLLNCSLTAIKSDSYNSGGAYQFTWNGNVCTSARGVTFTINSDNSIDVVATSVTADVWFRLKQNFQYGVGSYVISGCPSGGSTTTYYIESDNLNARDTGSSIVINRSSAYTDNIFLVVKSGTTFTGTFKPMICTASDYAISPKFVPYRPSWQELTTKEQANENNISYNQLMGVKNMAKPYGTSGTNNNVTYTYNADGTITVKSDSATHNQSSKRVATFTAPYAGKFLINGIPTGASNTSFFLNITGNGGVNRNITGDDEVNPTTAGYVYNIDIYVRANIEVDTTFSIMFRPASISDSTYQPYAPSNRELYEMILALQ